MTNDEAIYTLKNTAFLGWSEQAEKVSEAVWMAIDALNQLNNSKDQLNNSNNQLNNSKEDAISRQAAINAIEAEKTKRGDYLTSSYVGYEIAEEVVAKLPSAQPEQKTCEGCKHSGQWENELEYGASCPCLVCKRRASDNYERSD